MPHLSASDGLKREIVADEMGLFPHEVIFLIIIFKSHT